MFHCRHHIFANSQPVYVLHQGQTDCRSTFSWVSKSLSQSVETVNYIDMREIITYPFAVR